MRIISFLLSLVLCLGLTTGTFASSEPTDKITDPVPEQIIEAPVGTEEHAEAEAPAGTEEATGTEEPSEEPVLDGDGSVLGTGAAGESVTWTLTSDGTLTISGTGDMYDFDFSYDYGQTLTDFTMPDGSTVTMMGGTTFTDWFEYRTSITRIVVEEGVTGIGMASFMNLPNVRTAVLPDSLESIGDYAFAQCGRMESAAIPAGVTYIGVYAFNQCLWLDDVTIPSGVKELGTSTFESCASLKRLTLSEGLASIGESVFFRCYALEEVKLPSTLAKLGGGAFSSSGLKGTIALPASLAEVSSNAFSGSRGVDAITVDPENDTFIAVEGVVYTKDMTGIVLIPTGLKELTVPEGMKTIAAGLFRASGLEKVVLPEGLEVIEERAFEMCTQLREVNIPSTVVSIGRYAFSGTTRLGEITLPEGLTDIGRNAFDSSGLRHITVPGTVKNMGIALFSNCNNLETVVLEEGVAEITNFMFENDPGISWVMLPSTLKTVGQGDFSMCYCLSDAYYSGTREQWDAIGGSGRDDFRLTESLRPAGTWSPSDVGVKTPGTGEITWYVTQDDVLVISGSGPMEDYASGEDTPWYDQHESLLGLVVEDGVTHLGDNAFYNCGNIDIVRLPASVTSIGEGALTSAFYIHSTEVIVFGVNIMAGTYGHLYYGGTRDDWQRVDIAGRNGGLRYGMIHYRSEDVAGDVRELAAHAAPEPTPTPEPSPAPGKRGDVNDDGTVDRKDRIHLARYLAGWDGYDLAKTENADVNRDEAVDRKDRIHLARYLAGWDGYDLI